MKTYRTIDLLKAVYDGKIFKNKFKNVETGEEIYQGKGINSSCLKDIDQSKQFFRQCGINFAAGKTGTTLDFTHFLKEEWEEVQEPVNFMEAVKSGKKIKVEHEYINDLIEADSIVLKDYMAVAYLMEILSNKLLSSEIREVILNGKWYIKEDEE